MLNKNNLKLIAYKDLKTLLPAGNHLEKRYEKAKDKNQFDEYLYTVYEGDIHTYVFNPDDISWGDLYYDNVNTYENRLCNFPVVLGNVHCKTASLSAVLVTGNVHTKNISIDYTDPAQLVSQIMGNLTVDEVCYTQGKGLWGKTFYFNVNGDVNIHTWINEEQAAFKSKSLTVKKEFSFPQIYASEDRGKHAPKDTDWSQHSLEELTAYFNKEVLDIKEYGEGCIYSFFNIKTKLVNGDYDYLVKEGAQNMAEKVAVKTEKETTKKPLKEKEEESEEDKRQQKIFDDKTAHLKPGEKLSNDELTDVFLSLLEIPKKGKKEQQSYKIFKKETDKTSQPIETIILEGITFKVITLDQATLIGMLTDYKDNPIYGTEYSWSYPDSGVKPVFLLAEEDVEIEKLELHYNISEYPDIYILGYIFQKKITAFQYIQAYHHKETTPALIVLGNATAPVFILSGNTHYIGGNLTCGSLTARNKNGALYVKGDTIARLIHSKGMPMYFARFHAVDAICCTPYIKLQTMLLDENDNIFSVENDFPNTHFLSDIVHEDYIKTKRNGKEKLLDDYYETPVPALLNLQGKADRYNYTHFREQFIAMVKALASLPSVKAEGRKYEFKGDDTYIFLVNNDEDEPYLRLWINDEKQHIRSSGIYYLKTNAIELLLEYLDEDDNPKYQWEGDENTEGLEFSSVKHAMYRAFSM